MPRFEMHLMFTERDDDSVETSEIEMVCWVNDSTNLAEVQDRANEVIHDHLEEAEKEILFGTATILIKGHEVLNIGFRNKDVDPEEINEVVELFGSREETIH